MTTEHTAARWDDIYRRGGGRQNSWYTGQPAQALRLIADLSVPPSAAVVDVGGGAGNLVDGLLDAGFSDVTVLDVSATALGIARERLGATGDRATWIAQDLRTWRPPRMYDLWHDRALLHFQVEDADRQRYLDVLRCATRVGGHVVLGAFAPEGPTMCSGSPVRRYAPAELAEFLGPDFAMVTTDREMHVTPAGHEQPFVWAAFNRTT